MQELRLKDLKGLTVKEAIDKIREYLTMAYKILNDLGIEVEDYYFELADSDCGNIDNESIEWKNLHVKKIWIEKDDDDNVFWWNFKIETEEDINKAVL